MSRIIEKIEVFDELLSEIESDNIEFDELGTTSGFHDADESREKACAYVRDLVTRLSEQYEDLNEVMTLESLTKLETKFGQIKSTIASIQKIVEAGVHNPQFPNQRKTYTANLERCHSELEKEMYDLERDLKISELNSKFGDSEYFSTTRTSAGEYEEQAKNSAAEISKLLKSMKSQTVQKGVDTSAGEFDELFNHHKDYEDNWLLAVMASAGLLVVTVAYVLFFDPTPPKDSTNTYHAIQLFKRAFLVSIPAVFLRLSLTKYNTERALRIVYRHRGKVLEQFRSFEDGISDDSQAKDQFRLEIAKYIFSDPESGYSSKNKAASTEVNVNPIVSAAEKLSNSK